MNFKIERTTPITKNKLRINNRYILWGKFGDYDGWTLMLRAAAYQRCVDYVIELKYDIKNIKDETDEKR